MSRRKNAALRCSRCRMHGSLCVCALIPRVETRTRVVLVIHRFEDRKPTNTGRLATECLPNSTVLVRGRDGEPTPPFVPEPGSTPLLLFPHEGAAPIEEYLGSENVTLVVPDGNWRQASKVRKRVPGLSDLPCVSLSGGAPSLYRLRSEPREAGLSTIEAIARALGILEGPEVERSIERVFLAMVERTLWARGGIATSSVTGGIPEGAMRHDPKSGLARTRAEPPPSAPEVGAGQTGPGAFSVRLPPR